MLDMAYIARVGIAHAQPKRKSLLGAFPPPSQRTIVAAEAVKFMLETAKYPGTMAVSVTELKGGAGATQFVVSLSGYHPKLETQAGPASQTLQRALKEAGIPDPTARMIFARDLDPGYIAWHLAAPKYFQAVFGRDIRTAPVTANEIQTRVTAFGAALMQQAGTITRTVGLTTVAQPGQVTVFRPNSRVADLLDGVLGSCLALRLGLVVGGDLKAALPLLLNEARRLAALPDHRWRVLARFMMAYLREDLLDIPGASGLRMKAAADAAKELAAKQRDDMRKQAATDGKSKKEIDKINVPVPEGAVLDAQIVSAFTRAAEAFGNGPLGLHCAEPKAFRYAREAMVDLVKLPPDGQAKTLPRFASGRQGGVVRGQLAFWWSGADKPRDFSKALLIIGPRTNQEAHTTGGYMAPCESCRARSAAMMEGLGR